MRTPRLWILLFGAFVFAWIISSVLRDVQGAARQNSASHPPQAPAIEPAPSDPIETRPVRPGLPPDFEDNTRPERPRPRRVDTAQAAKDAQELSVLSKKVQGEVAQLSKNIYAKDLAGDLKQVQKLAKRLRGEIAP